MYYFSVSVLQSRDRGVALVSASYLEDAEANLPAPSIRIAVSNLLSCREIREAAQEVRQVCRQVFGGGEEEEERRKEKEEDEEEED